MVFLLAELPKSYKFGKDVSIGKSLKAGAILIEKAR